MSSRILCLHAAGWHAPLWIVLFPMHVSARWAPWCGPVLGNVLIRDTYVRDVAGVVQCAITIHGIESLGVALACLRVVLVLI